MIIVPPSTPTACPKGGQKTNEESIDEEAINAIHFPGKQRVDP